MAKYRIWAWVSGRLGTRQAWLKENGEIWETDDPYEASKKASKLNNEMNGLYSQAKYDYSVRRA